MQTCERSTVHNRVALVDGIRMFFREAGDRTCQPTLLLLHGFPSSSHMFRRLMPLLADHYHIIAPDFPGFGFSDAPARSHFRYTFKNLALITEHLVESLGIQQYVLYLFDYGAAIGLRMAIRHPERVLGLIAQNGNAYEGGLSKAWRPVRRYWRDPSSRDNRNALRAFLQDAAVKDQYFHGVSKSRQAHIDPEAFLLDQALLRRPGNDEIQLDLLLDYATNVALYPAFHAYFRQFQPPLLIVWGFNDPFFLPRGALAYRRDLPNARVHFLLDGGHYVVETHVGELAQAICEFMSHNGKDADGSCDNCDSPQLQQTMSQDKSRKSERASSSIGHPTPSMTCDISADGNREAFSKMQQRSCLVTIFSFLNFDSFFDATHPRSENCQKGAAGAVPRVCQRWQIAADRAPKHINFQFDCDDWFGEKWHTRAVVASMQHAASSRGRLISLAFPNWHDDHGEFFRKAFWPLRDGASTLAAIRNVPLLYSQWEEALEYVQTCRALVEFSLHPDFPPDPLRHPSSIGCWSKIQLLTATRRRKQQPQKKMSVPVVAPAFFLRPPPPPSPSPPQSKVVTAARKQQPVRCMLAAVLMIAVGCLGAVYLYAA